MLLPLDRGSFWFSHIFRILESLEKLGSSGCSELGTGLERSDFLHEVGEVIQLVVFRPRHIWILVGADSPPGVGWTERAVPMYALNLNGCMPMCADVCRCMPMFALQVNGKQTRSTQLKELGRVIACIEIETSTPVATPVITTCTGLQDSPFRVPSGAPSGWTGSSKSTHVR